jgi:sugar (pentulose or hexulose) kinase
MQCIGLDIGSTSIKGCVLDLLQHDMGCVVQRPFPAPLAGLAPGCFEIDPLAVVEVAQVVLKELLGEAPCSQAVFCSGQMGGVILVDSSGAARTNYLSWRDQRTLQPLGNAANHLQAIREKWSEDELACLGNELQAGSVTSLLFWLVEHDRLPDGPVHPATIADFVLGQLCRATPQMDPTQAIGLLDLRSGGWHRSAFEKLGLGGIVWPQLADFSTPMGFWSVGGKRLACHASFGDQPCALKGIDLSHNELSINISTGSQVSQLTSTFVPGCYQSRRYFGGDYLNTLTHLPAGRSLNVLMDLLTELARAEGVTLPRAWEYIARTAEDAAGQGLKVDLAFFAGPLGSVGSVEDITTDNLTIGNLFRAAFQNMADNYARCAERLGANRPGMSLALSGGLTRAIPILRRLVQEQFDLPMRESAAAEETLLGLLKIAADVYRTTVTDDQ